jgi:hypothetical protein
MTARTKKSRAKRATSPSAPAPPGTDLGLIPFSLEPGERSPKCYYVERGLLRVHLLYRDHQAGWLGHRTPDGVSWSNAVHCMRCHRDWPGFSAFLGTERCGYRRPVQALGASK